MNKTREKKGTKIYLALNSECFGRPKAREQYYHQLHPIKVVCPSSLFYWPGRLSIIPSPQQQHSGCGSGRAKYQLYGISLIVDIFITVFAYTRLQINGLKITPRLIAPESHRNVDHTLVRFRCELGPSHQLKFFFKIQIYVSLLGPN